MSRLRAASLHYVVIIANTLAKFKRGWYNTSLRPIISQLLTCDRKTATGFAESIILRSAN